MVTNNKGCDDEYKLFSKEKYNNIHIISKCNIYAC